LLFITYQIYPVFIYGLNNTSKPVNNMGLDNSRHYETFSSKHINNLDQKKISNDKPELNSLMDMRDLNKLKYVSLVFASQNFRSPISSFGHTLLVFHNHVTPEPDSPTFEYLGTTSVSFFAIRALFWSIPGYYRLIPWNQKYWEYERENRDIWLVPLKITSTERAELNRLVKESLPVTTDSYNFLFTNCSWYIFKIIQIMIVKNIIGYYFHICMTNHQDVIDFWFQELNPEQWFKEDKSLDQQIKKNFLSTHNAAIKGELYKWRTKALGRLAEIIVIDQFSRNIFREDPRSYLYDGMALALSQEAIQVGSHKKMKPLQRSFLYMPFMHSESRIIQEKAVKLFSEPKLNFNLEFAYKHKKIIDRFGRYPHRNKVLKRPSTPEEIDFLQKNKILIF